jgi:hypothetical protein
MGENRNNDIESRLGELVQPILNNSINDPTGLSIEALLDGFLVLYDECSNSTLRQEKSIKEFVEHGNSLFLFYYLLI